MRSNRLFVFACGLMLLLASACGAPAVGNYFAPTAAVVNGVKIPEEQVSEQLRSTISNPQNRAQFVGVSGGKNRLDAKREILSQLIRQVIVVQQAKGLGIAASSSEVTAQLKQLRSRFPTEKAFLAEVSKEGFTLEDVNRFVTDRLVFQKVASEVTKSAAPTEAQIQAYYDQNRAQFDSQVHAAHILVCGDFDQTKRACNFTPEDEATAKDIAKRAKAGEDFAALAKQFSKDGSNKDSGGDLGFFGKGQMAVEFENAAFALQPGQISDPVKTNFGFHIIKLIAKGKSFEDSKQEITKGLGQQTQQQAFQKWLQGKLAKANVRVNPIFGEFDRTTQSVVPGKTTLARTGGGVRLTPPRR
ncbi:MAG: peptidylprolyl isomerase [Actinomycetota bacterium]|nr:peptidylprolyl isomerase [Actinomycetota bacterium]